MSRFLQCLDYLLSYLRNICKKKNDNVLIDALSQNKVLDCENAIRFIESNLCNEPGRYLYAPQKGKPVLYASAYAAMTYSLLGKLDSFSESQIKEWIQYINDFQCEDGLYRDPSLKNEIAEEEDWWGWRHLAGQIICALTGLGSKTLYPFRFLEFLYKKGDAERWVASLPWDTKADFVSNTVMNYGVLLQYNRDFWGIKEAGDALCEILDWLDTVQNPQTGCWGHFEDKQMEKSLEIQTAYHLWVLYFYDNRPIHYMEQAIDSLLSSQNKLGGFGVASNSSACEDIDSIDPLCRFYFLTDYRRQDIREALEKALKWVPLNQNEDGGFVFRRFEPLAYGHELMTTAKDESSLFPVWFRILSLTYIAQVLKDDPVLSKTKWNFVKCPGYQFWNYYNTPQKLDKILV